MSFEVLNKRAMLAAGFGVVLLAACSAPVAPLPNNIASGSPTAAPSASPASTPSQGPVLMTVTVNNMAFNPPSLTVPVGSTVTWDFEDTMQHTTTSDKGDAQQWDSGPLSKGNSYRVKFTTAGTYTYHCALHSSMTGTITVQ